MLSRLAVAVEHRSRQIDDLGSGQIGGGDHLKSCHQHVSLAYNVKFIVQQERDISESRPALLLEGTQPRLVYRPPNSVVGQRPALEALVGCLGSGCQRGR
jgi:hypothetical protein